MQGFCLFVFYKFIILFLAALGLCCCVRAFSSCVEQGAPLCCGESFSLPWLLSLRSAGSRHVGFRQLWLMGSRAQAQQLWHMGLVALRHVGSSRTRALTCVPCIGRRILNHCATREVPVCLFVFVLFCFCFAPMQGSGSQYGRYSAVTLKL